MIDNIERNIEQTVDYVKSAKTETKAAVEYQSKARRVSFLILNTSFFKITLRESIATVQISQKGRFYFKLESSTWPFWPF